MMRACGRIEFTARSEDIDFVEKTAAVLSEPGTFVAFFVMTLVCSVFARVFGWLLRAGRIQAIRTTTEDFDFSRVKLLRVRRNSGWAAGSSTPNRGLNIWKISIPSTSRSSTSPS